MGNAKLFLLAVLCLVGSFALTHAVGAGYQEPCLEPSTPPLIQCDVLKHLVCSNVTHGGICVCMEDNWMYDRLNQECVVKAGGTGCRERVASLPIANCTRFAHCDQPDVDVNGTCLCNEGYKAAAAGGECKLGYGTSGCRGDRDCYEPSFLVCTNSTCQCKMDTSVWNPAGEKCSPRVGQTCGSGVEPTCDSAFNMECDSTTSQCDCIKPTYTQDEDNLCYVDYDQPCNADGDCHSMFPWCRTVSGSKKCACKQGETYNPDHTCHILAEKPCDPAMDKCALHSTCNETSRTCQCRDKYFPYLDKCLGGFDADCDVEEDCNRGGLNLVCNANKKCECATTHEPVDGVCLKKRDEPCSSDQECASGNCENEKCGCPAGQASDPQGECKVMAGESCEIVGETNNCGPNSHCNDTLICDCLPGFSPDENNGWCKGNLDTDCSAPSDCNSNHNLTCPTNADPKKCVCQDEFMPINGVCLLKFGQECLNNEECASNSCPSGTCACPDGLEEYQNTCKATYQGQCSNSEDCYPGYFLNCLSSQCLCVNDTIHETTRPFRCNIKAGGECSNNNDCVENSNCFGGGTGGSSCRCFDTHHATENGTCAEGTSDASLTNMASAFLIICSSVSFFLYH